MIARGVTPAGTRVIWVESAEPELAYVSLSFAVGFGTVPPHAAHFAHFVEHIVAHLEPDERRRVDAAGVSCNASTSEHHTSFYASGLASGLVKVYLPLLAARLRSPPSDARMHRNEASAVVTEIQQHAAQPSAAHATHVARHERPDSLDAVGFPAHVAFMSRLVRTPDPALVSSYVRAHYVPARAHLCVSCSPELRGTLVAAALAALGGAPGFSPPRMPRAAPSARTRPKETTSVEPCAPEAKTHISVLVPISVSAAELLVAEFCAETLRTELFDELRTRLGLLYSVHVSYVSHSPTAREHARCRQELVVYAMCTGTNAVAAVDATRRVIADLEVTESRAVEWCDARRASVLSARACRTPSSLASWYEESSLSEYPLRSHEDVLAMLRSFPVERARDVGFAVRSAPLRVYVTTGDANVDAVRASVLD
jgi:predicted Zn-dependent peptidase